MLRVDGSATLYRLYDVGYTVDLEHAAALLGAGTRVRPRRVDARAIEIRNPPLLVVLGSADFTASGERYQAMLAAHLFDFGVCSLQLRFAAPRDLTWPTFAEFGARVDSLPELSAVFERALHDVVDRIRPAVERPAIAPLSEEYKMFRVDRIADGDGRDGTVAHLLTDEDIVALLIGEHQHLSSAARRELIPHRFSYYDTDLTILSWESALIIEPRAEDRDVEYVLEFANAQLLELRMYDLQLDAELPALYDRAQAARARGIPRFAGRFRAVLSDLQTRVADITETVERVENALKVTNDVYLARIYAAALELFREQAWRRGIERKLGILRDTYAMLNGEAQAARTEVLEVAVVLLIVAEIVLGLLRG